MYQKVLFVFVFVLLSSVSYGQYAVEYSGAVTEVLPFPLPGQILNEFTVEGFYNLTGDDSGYLFIKYDISGDNHLMFEYNYNEGDPSVFLWAHDHSNNSNVMISENTNFNDGQWHHLVGECYNGQLYFYIDGTIVGNEAFGSHQFTGHSFAIGGQLHEGTPNAQFYGMTDEFRMSTVARYEGQTFDIPTEPFIPDDDTAFLFHFNEGEGEPENAVDNEYYGLFYGTGSAWVDGYPFNIVGPELITPENESSEVIVDQVNFTWEAVDEALLYQLQVAAYEDFTNLVVDLSELSDLEYMAGEFELATQYYWRVRGYNNVSEGDWSDIWTFTTEFPPLPDAPSLVAPPNTSTEVSVSDVQFVWDALENTDCYHFVLSDDPTFSTTFVDAEGITETSHVIDQLDFETLYYWKVAACNITGQGNWSDTWSFTTEEDVAVDEESIFPMTYELLEPYPNPFNATLSVKIKLPEKSDLKLSVLNILGQEVALISDGILNKGIHPFTFEAKNLPSGVYLLKAYIPGKMNTFKKIILMK